MKTLRTVFAYFIILVLFFFKFVSSTYAGQIANEQNPGLGKQIQTFLPQEVLREAFKRISSTELTKSRFSFFFNGRQFVATTTINQSFQAYLDSLYQNSIGAVSAIVCIDPISGRIEAMSGFDRITPLSKVWTSRLVPSASLFKIITAAGAMEFHFLGPRSTLYFNGRRHTLYKYQLEDKKNRYTTKVTLAEAFAKSINPVFGKLGISVLGKAEILEMARRFLWESPIPFELPVKISPLDIGPEQYNLAEVASGFNRKTRITALHEALLSAAVANGGVIMAPSFIDSVVEKGGEMVYQNRFYPLKRAVNPKTARLLNHLMQETVKSGTAKRAFRGWKKDKVLSRLVIGGKTGTIDSDYHHFRYDLFTGFACDSKTGRCLAVGVFVAHEGVLGRRSASYARLAFRKYFEITEQ